MSRPSMVAIRKQDLIRLLLKALSGLGGADVRRGAEYSPVPANNSDSATPGVGGIDGDLALEKWFQLESWR